MKFEDKIVKTITAFVPGSICNFRCNYCYVSKCYDESHLVKAKYDYPLETMIEAFNPERFGGLAEITVISGGETLIDNTIVPFIKGLLKYGHVVTVVTNLSLNEKIDELLDLDVKYLKRLIVKASLHWKELKRLNKIDDYFNNVQKIINKGASCYPSLVVAKDYLEYFDDVQKTCMDRLGVMPHCTPALKFGAPEDIIRDGSVETDPECTEDFVKYIDEKFDSKIFDTCVKFINVDVKKIFCYAGEWSFSVILKNGEIRKCHNCIPEGNFYENIKKTPKLLPIGNNCEISTCCLQYNFVSENLIPECNFVETYGKILYKKGLINEEVKNLLDFKYTNMYKQYNKKQQTKINKKVKNFFEQKNKKKENNFLIKLYKKLKNRLFN